MADKTAHQTYIWPPSLCLSFLILAPWFHPEMSQSVSNPSAVPATILVPSGDTATQVRGRLGLAAFQLKSR